MKTSSSDVKSLIAVVSDIYLKSGVKGFYPSYRATLAKNIPSAVIRFTLYEELKIIIGTDELNGSGSKSRRAVLLMLAGSAASMISSACSTPFDVIKTRVALGTISQSTPIYKAIADIIRFEGVQGIYAGITKTI